MIPPELSRTPVISVERCDPERLIRDAFAGVGDWQPRELYLAWLLALPAEIDAADAAALLLERTPSPAAGDVAGQALAALLETTTSYPRERLDPQKPVLRALH